MNKPLSRIILAFVMFQTGSMAQPTELVAEDIPAETLAQHDARMQWWQEANFWMLIHWRLYVVPWPTLLCLIYMAFWKLCQPQFNWPRQQTARSLP